MARGQQFERQRAYRDAERAFRQATQDDPTSAEAFAALARVLERTNNIDGADEAAAEAIRLNPGDLQVRVTQANLRRRVGAFAEARELFERVLLDEESVRCARFSDAMLAVAWNRYGLTLDALHESEAAIAAFTRSSAIRWSMPDAEGIDDTAPLRRVTATRSFLTADRVAGWAQAEGRESDEPDDPVFLAGFPRSGTTLTERLLGAHPRAAILDEDSPVRDMILEARKMVGGMPYPDVFDQLRPVQVRELRRCYWAGVARRGGTDLSRRRLIDKVPLHLMDLAAIVRVFPSARVLMAIRDPRDVCVSAAMQLMVPNPAMANLRTIKSAARFYEHVMGMWIEVRGRLTNPVFETRYEDLVATPEPTARRLIAFVGLDWDDAVMRFHEQARGAFIATPSFEAVAKPISSNAQGRWVRYEAWLAPVMDALQPFLEEWGYA